MRAFVSSVVVVTAAAFAGGCGNPTAAMGVDCRTSPGCWEREQERQREDLAEKRKDCKGRGLVHVDDVATLRCELSRNSCRMIEPGVSVGCGKGWSCGVPGNEEASFCNGASTDSDVPTWCARCADRGLAERELAAREQGQRDLEARIARDTAIAADEERDGRCRPERKAALQRALAEVEQAQREFAFEPVTRGEVVATEAGAPLTVTITADGTYIIAAVSTLGISVHGPDVRSGGWDADPRPDKAYTATDTSLDQKDGLRQEWKAVGHGCTLWSVLVRK